MAKKRPAKKRITPRNKKQTRYIVVLDPAVRRPELEAFNRMAANSPLPLSYHLPALFGLDSLQNDHGQKPSGIIILGSLSSVNDGLEWQKAMNDWLRQCWQDGVPTLGICYGHQLIAHLHGGKIGYNHPERTKHSGLRKVSLLADKLWGGVALEGHIAVSHEEEVKECPDGFRVVGTSDKVRIEALAHKKLPIWSFQAHPEATPNFFKTRSINDSTNGGCLKFGHSLVQSFLDFVAKRKT